MTVWKACILYKKRRQKTQTETRERERERDRTHNLCFQTRSYKETQKMFLGSCRVGDFS